jgi:hypothetical protein
MFTPAGMYILSAEEELQMRYCILNPECITHTDIGMGSNTYLLPRALQLRLT